MINGKNVQRWTKYGNIFDPNDSPQNQLTHASLPVAEQLEGYQYRIYFASRDRESRSHCHFIDIDIREPSKILGRSLSPILSPGKGGFFDDCGVTPTWIVKSSGRKWMYYEGWNLGKSAKIFHISLGLASALEGSSDFVKYSDGPILDRSVHDPCLVGSSSILIEDGIWRLWYVSGVEWRSSPSAPEPRFHIKYAESTDGINWTRNGLVCIDFLDVDEVGICAPRVIKQNGIYRMWYSYLRKTYQIGYAESGDGLVWQRLDHLSGPKVSSNGWDSEMICYPFVFKHDEQVFMLYNGNSYGKTGFGLAILNE